jgi:hypothetical protein
VIADRLPKCLTSADLLAIPNPRLILTSRYELIAMISAVTPIRKIRQIGTASMTSSTRNPSEKANNLPLRWFALVAALIVFLFVQCMLTTKRDSVNWDESQHLYSG